MTDESLNLTETAELYRLGLICGYYSLPFAIGWADAAIAQEEAPPLALAEFSMASSEPVEDALRYLYPLASGADTDARARDLYGLLFRRLDRSPSDAQWVALRAYVLAKEVEDTKLAARANAWDDELYPESGWGNPEAIKREMRETLGAYHPTPGALEHEA